MTYKSSGFVTNSFRGDFFTATGCKKLFPALVLMTRSSSEDQTVGKFAVLGRFLHGSQFLSIN